MGRSKNRLTLFGSGVLTPKLLLGTLGLAIVFILGVLVKNHSPQAAITRAPAVLIPAEPTLSESYEGPFATVLTATGDVIYLRDGVPYPATPNITLIAADTITTSTGGEASVLFGDGSILRLDQNTSILLATYANQDDIWSIRLKQMAGTTWNRVQKLLGGSSYEVETSTTVATVRGTAFSVESSMDSSAVTVSEGTVVAQIMDPSEPVARTLVEIPVKASESTSVDKADVTAAEQAKTNKQDVKKAVSRTQPKKVDPKKTKPWVTKNVTEDKKVAPFLEEVKKDIMSRQRDNRIRAIQRLRERAGLPQPTTAAPQPTLPAMTGTSGATPGPTGSTGAVTTPTVRVPPGRSSAATPTPTAVSPTPIPRSTTPSPTPIDRGNSENSNSIHNRATPTPIPRSTTPSPTPLVLLPTSTPVLSNNRPTPTPSSPPINGVADIVR